MFINLVDSSSQQPKGPFSPGKYGGRGMSPSRAAADSQYKIMQTGTDGPWFYNFRPANAQVKPFYMLFLNDIRHIEYMMSMRYRALPAEP